MGKYSISKKAVADLDDIWNYSHHIIFFKRKEDGNIWVDRILHEMMDFQRHFD